MFSLYLRRSPVLAGILFVLIGGIGALAFGAKVVHLVQVTSELYPGEGTVLTVHPPARKTPPKLEVRFQDRDGIAHVRTVAVSRSTWTQYRQGGPVGLYISGVDGNEAWARSEGNPPPWDLAVPAGIGLVMVLIGTLITLNSLRNVGRRVRALQTGVPFPGSVVSVVEGSGKSRGRWTVTYAWTVNGREHRSTSPTLRAPEAERYRPDDEVPVFVDPLAEDNGEVDWFGYCPASR